jgi:hypothetical protein
LNEEFQTMTLKAECNLSEEFRAMTMLAECKLNEEFQTMTLLAEYNFFQLHKEGGNLRVHKDHRNA